MGKFTFTQTEIPGEELYNKYNVLFSSIYIVFSVFNKLYVLKGENKTFLYENS